jgi:hypothetical protein
MKIGINDAQFANVAKKIECELAMIKAVDKIESKGSGFLPTGEVKILFEPHIFWKYLRRAGITPVRSEICYPVWKTEPYGKTSEQHGRLQLAIKINRDIALMSASWGRFQIMGFNFKACGCKTIQEFINKNHESEVAQLYLFANYIINVNLDDELIERDFTGFARGYNGPLHVRNNYAGKLRSAYLLFKTK